jgi:glycosyltransferase involved in cell wall biosynthesis
VFISVDLEKFSPESLPTPRDVRHQLGLSGDGPVVGMVARLQRWKGVHVFIDAAARLAIRHPKVKFLVVGGVHWAEPHYLKELRDQATSAGIADRVAFVGLQSDVPLWMQAMDIIVHASNNEPTGTVILEAMALGKPVVCAKTEGPLEVLDDEVHGLATEPGNAAALASAIDRFLCDPILSQSCGERAFARARKFGSDRLARDMHMGLLEAIRE